MSVLNTNSNLRIASVRRVLYAISYCTGSCYNGARLYQQTKYTVSLYKGLHGKVPTYIQEMITPSKSKIHSITSNEGRAQTLYRDTIDYDNGNGLD